MLSVIKRNPVAAFLALLLHLLIIAYLVFGIDWSSSPKAVTPKAQVVQAKVVDAAKVEAEMKKLRQAEARKQSAKAAQLRREEQRLRDLKRRQAAEKRRLAKLEKERKAKELAARKRRAEQQRQARLQKQRAAAEAKRKAQAEAKRKAAAEAKRKAEAAAQAARERALQEQLAAEQNAREVDRYVAVIKQQVERNWRRPPNTREGLSCIVQVRLIPGGDVVPGSVVILKGSGNPAFDRSVENAVYKAAPLPVPSGGLFESFRSLRLNFKPTGK